LDTRRGTPPCCSRQLLFIHNFWLYLHLPQILTYFVHRITNATSEGINSVIQRLKIRACGYRNTNNYITAIYFHCGGLDLYPTPPVQHATPSEAG